MLLTAVALSLGTQAVIAREGKAALKQAGYHPALLLFPAPLALPADQGAHGGDQS